MTGEYLITAIAHPAPAWEPLIEDKDFEAFYNVQENILLMKFYQHEELELREAYIRHDRNEATAEAVATWQGYVETLKKQQQKQASELAEMAAKQVAEDTIHF
jgi:hypothetical protein